VSANATPATKPLSLGVIFLTLYIDLIGFSLFFPLGPALLQYYIAHEPAGGLFATVFAKLQDLGGSTHLPEMATAALFAGLTGSLYSLMQFLFSPIWGGYSDRVGRRRVLLLTIAGNAFSFLLLAFSGSFTVFLVGRILSGIMGGNLAVAVAAVADVTTRENRAKGMGMVGAAFALGFLTGPLIGGLTGHLNVLGADPSLARFGLHPFTITAAIGFILCLLNLVWISLRFSETLSPEVRNAASPRERNPLRSLLTLPDRALRRANVIGFLIVFAFSFFETTISFFAADKFGFGPWKLAQVFVFLGVVSMITQGFLVRRFIPRIGEKRAAVGGMAVQAAGLIALGLAIGVAESIPAMFVALAFSAVGSGFASVGMTSLVSLYAPPSEQGRVNGIYRSLGFLARAASPAVAGILFFKAGGTVTFAVAGCILFVPMVLGLALPQPAK
jgi:MFS family permease